MEQAALFARQSVCDQRFRAASTAFFAHVFVVAAIWRGLVFCCLVFVAGGACLETGGDAQSSQKVAHSRAATDAPLSPPPQSPLNQAVRDKNFHRWSGGQRVFWVRQVRRRG